MYSSIGYQIKVFLPNSKCLLEVVEGFIPTLHVSFSYESNEDIKNMADVLKKDFVFLCNKEGIVQIIKTALPLQEEKVGQEILREIHSPEEFNSAMKERIMVSPHSFIY
jgi:hypothetical protein